MENQKTTYLKVLKKHLEVLTKELKEDETELRPLAGLGSNEYADRIRDFLRECADAEMNLQHKIAVEEDNPE